MGGVRLGPAVAGVLYGLLVASAALALWAQRGPGHLPHTLQHAAPWVFLGFVLAFSVYRLALVRAGRYPAFKAFFQIGAAILFFTLLLPRARVPYEAPDPLRELLHDGNPSVRSLAAEVVPTRANGSVYGRDLVEALNDEDGEVRATAHSSLVKLSGGQDLGPAESDTARAAWRAKYP